MPYSMDTDSNKENPVTPSEYYSLNGQVMYKLAALDSAVQAGFRRLDEKMDRFQTDLHDNQLETNDRINDLDKELTARLDYKRARIDALEKNWENKFQNYCKTNDNRIQEIEVWQKVLVARGAMALGVVVIIWTVFGNFIQRFFGIT